VCASLAIACGLASVVADVRAALRIDSSSVSRRHALVVIQDGAATLEDLGRKNGTFLRGKRISAPMALVDGDEFRLGRVRIGRRRPEAAP
jgi:pSer/pThr/pTyr-binding forkhead associated (FHA) protein